MLWASNVQKRCLVSRVDLLVFVIYDQNVYAHNMSVLLDYWLDLTTVCLLKLQKKFPKLTHIFGIPFFELIDKNILEIWFTDRLWKYKSQMVNYVAMYVVEVM